MVVVEIILLLLLSSVTISEETDLSGTLLMIRNESNKIPRLQGSKDLNFQFCYKSAHHPGIILNTRTPAINTLDSGKEIGNTGGTSVQQLGSPGVN